MQQRTLMIKGVVILATVLICLFGIIGFPRNLKQLESNVTSRIHLGLDLKGGMHLVLQVQVQDAAKTEADQTIENLRDTLKTAGIIVAGYDRNDPQTLAETDSIQVNIHGVDQAKTQQFRNIVADKFQDWTLTPLN